MANVTTEWGLDSVSSLAFPGLIQLSYPDKVREKVKLAVQSWKMFCSLSQEEKEAFTFVEDAHGDGVGYELKADKSKQIDLKENFHVTLFQHTRLAQIGQGHRLPFLDDAKAIFDALEPLIREVTQAIENEYQLEGLVDDVMKHKEYWILRYLHYFGDQAEGALLAAPHADKGAFTLHLFESDPGLEYYSLDRREWQALPVSEKQTVIISGLQLQQLSKGILKGLYHRVVATETTARLGRFSMVFFVALQNSPMYNKKRHDSVQTQAVGFNYDLLHEAFAKFFA